MRETTTSRGTTLRVPDHVQVVDDAAAAGRTARRGPSRVNVVGDEAENGLFEGLVGEDVGLAVHDRFVLDPALATSAPARRGGAARRGDEEPGSDVEIEVSLDEKENAALLVEIDGVYAWHLPEPRAPAGAPRRRSGTVSGRTVMFRLGRSSGMAEPSGTAPLGRRGLGEWVGGRIVDRVRATVVKWIVRRAVGPAMRLVERNVRPGLVDMGNANPRTWGPGRPLPSLPKDRPARILLFVHGTFSSTSGSFHALGVTQEGRAFLSGARRRYDAVLAFDHATLGESPQENAAAIARALEDLGADRTSRLDIVAFSRGGLVARLLVERHFAGATRPLTPGSVVFVGCTNGGTALADPANWKALLDLHTNLAVAAGRALSLFGAGPAGRAVAESVKTLGVFVQAIVDAAITEEMVPGLAAMMPTSSLVADLNREPIGPDAPDVRYHAIGSDFEPTLLGVDANSHALPKRLIQALADMGVDALMKEENDLVVDTEAMTMFGRHGERLGESRLWSRNGSLHHTAYFTHPEVAHSLSRWLLSEGADWHARWRKEDIQVLDADTPVAEVIDAISGGPSVVVLERGSYGFYVRSSNDLERQLRNADPDQPVVVALDLHETQIAEVDGSAAAADVARVSATGWVRFDGSTVVEAILPAASGPALPETDAAGAPAATSRGAGRSADPNLSASVRRPARRDAAAASPVGRAPSPFPPPAASSSTRIPASPRSANASPEEADSTMCHFGAEMPETCPLGAPALLSVSVSREEIEIVEGPTASRATALVSTATPISIEIVTQGNCRVVGPSLVENLVLPDTGVEVFDFKIEGLAEGEAELHVIARQGARRLTRMVLQPTFVRLGQAMRATATARESQEEPAAVELRIIEEGVDDDRYRLRFILDSDDLDMGAVNVAHDVHRTKDRVVADFYERMEGEWGQDLADFDTFMDQVRSYGAKLYNEVVPEEVRQAIWTHRDAIGVIRVVSEEPSIPWELLVTTDGETGRLAAGSVFLGELGLVRWIDNLHRAPARLEAREGRAFRVVPDYVDPRLRLKGAQREIETLEGLFGAREIEARRRSVIERLQAGSEIDLLHFACHGHARGDDIWSAALSMTGRKREGGGYVIEALSLSDVELNAAFSREGNGRPVVFINACQAGASGRSLTGTGGMAKAFILRGAGLFVSTLWSIGDDVAHTFARSFYEALLDGSTVAASARIARQAARGAREPTWIAYTIYGHPYARLER